MAEPEPTTTTTLVPGTMLGKHQVLRLLAVGGMAEIYLARTTGIAGFEKAVVLKRILPQLADDPEFVAMFLDEARLTASLSHPNVVQVYEVDRIGQSFFFTLEHVHGRDLGAVLREAAKKKRGLSLAHALYVMREVAAGLHYAHDKKGKDGQPLGTVHRDVSPSNVMLTYDGRVKIVDFGIAKAAMRQTKTHTGTVKGKIWYMSPEQAQGQDLDRRSDVFSLGILLYELSTGTRPFRAKNEFGVLYKIVNEDVPDPRTRRASFPAELARIVMKALCRDREGRYGTAEELKNELDAFAHAENLVASSATLGAFMRELFDEREDTADLFALPKRPEATPAPEETSTPERSRDSTPTRAEAEAQAESAMSTSRVIPLTRRKLWPAVAVTLFGAAALGLWALSKRPVTSSVEPQATAPTATSAATASTPATTAEPVPSPPAPAEESAASDAGSPITAPSAPSVRPVARPEPREPRMPRETTKSAPAPPASAGKDPKKWNLDSPLPP